MKRTVPLILMCAASMFIAVEGTSLAADDISEVAKTHFRAGVSLLEDQDGARYEEAYSEFKASYAASHSPKVLGNVGYCAMRLERDGEAIDAYTRYLAEVDDIPKDERDQITRDLATLKTSTVRIDIRADLPDATIADVRLPARGGPITNVYRATGAIGEIRVRPGHHQIRLKLGNSESASWDFDAMPGKPSSHFFKLKPDPVAKKAPKPVNAMPWILAGTGAAMLAGGAITGILAMNKTKDLEKTCPGNACPAGTDLDASRRDINLFSRVTDGLLIAGGVSVISGVTWLLLSSNPSPTATRPNVACSTSGCMAQLGGSF